MPFIKKSVNEDEWIELLLQHESLVEMYKKIRGGDIKYCATKEMPWFFNEGENSAFCILELGFDMSSRDGKSIFLLRVGDDDIIFELKGYNSVVFLHGSSLFERDLYKIKYLITAAFSVVGRWGSGDVESLNNVPDPVFTFTPRVGD